MRGASRLGRPLERCSVLVVGDTPRDVRAAQAIGARCLAVATGPHSRSDLQAAGAHWTVDSLEDSVALEVVARGEVV